MVGPGRLHRDRPRIRRAGHVGGLLLGARRIPGARAWAIREAGGMSSMAFAVLALAFSLALLAGAVFVLAHQVSLFRHTVVSGDS